MSVSRLALVALALAVFFAVIVLLASAAHADTGWNGTLGTLTNHVKPQMVYCCR